MRILVVDDEVTIRGWLGAHLTEWGHEPRLVSGVEEALALFQDETFPLVITDWLMPDRDGLELVKALRSRAPSLAYTYILMATVKGGKTNYLEALEAGADDFIQKPLDAETLAARIKVVERWQAVLKEMNHLRGLLPVCSYCKNIRDEHEEWEPLETYVAKHSEAHFTHVICPKCMERCVRPELDELRKGGASI